MSAMGDSTTNNGALSGIRVLDMTSVIMGPYATQLLGDLGAEVIKIESRRGDTNRFMGGGPHPEFSGIALNINRNKRSAGIDLKHPDGLAAMKRLLGSCDVFVTNLRPGPLRRMGMDFEAIAATNPRLIYCQAQGFRTDTDEGDRPAYDDIIQAAAGIPTLSEATVGATSFLPSVIADKIAGQTIVTAVLAAIVHRERTGRGQRVEVPMFDAVMAFNLVEHMGRAATPGQPAGYTRILSRWRGPHRTRDGYIAMMPYTDEHWRRLFAAVGREELMDESWMADHSRRLLEPDPVYSALAEIIAQRTTAEWLDLCEEHSIPANNVPTLDDILDDPALHRGMVTMTDHPVAGEHRSINPGMIMSDTPATVRRPAPRRAEHTAELLREIGYDAEQIAELGASGAIELRD
jgi:crotonobetainyl-CoA:carnitine CoA-transferase CaiB-like acyl-CoA transferase